MLSLTRFIGLLFPDNALGKRWRGWWWTRGAKGDRRGIKICRSAVLQRPENICWSPNIYVAEGVIITAGASVRLGEGVLIGPYSVITTCNHLRDREGYTAKTHHKSVEIGAGSWIAAHATVTPGTQIGKGVLLGAGAVASGTLESDTVYLGIPAQKRGELDLSPVSLSQECVREHYESEDWS